MQTNIAHQSSGEYQGKKYLTLTLGSETDDRTGIYARGGCDVPALFACAPLLSKVARGTWSIVHEGSVADSRSDLLLQSLQPHPREVVGPLIEKLNLHPYYFEPHLFDKAFILPHNGELAQFHKRVVIMSIGPDVIRLVYRHRDTGLLVDPGGMWLGRPMEEVLEDVSAAHWFSENFVSVGRIDVSEFVANFTRIIELLKEEVTSSVLVLNSLGPDPRGVSHNYQWIKDPLPIRRRQFNLALVELSRQLDFSIVDINRVLQEIGIRDQPDWGHTNLRQFVPIAEEIFRVMGELGVF